MPVQKEIRKKANIYFFSKVVFNALLIVLGAVLIALFLRQMQHKTALTKQRENSEQALAEAVSIQEKNAEDAAELTRVYHDANQDMLDDLKELLLSGLFDSLATADAATRSQVFADMVERSGVDYLFIMSDEGKVLLSPYEDYTGADLAEMGLLTEDNVALLRRGTREDDGAVTPAKEDNSYGYFYFYSESIAYGPSEFCVVLGADAALLDALRACPDPKTAWETAGRLAAERGYRLAPAPEKEALSDDELDHVAGGLDPALLADREINRYSWFVTLLRRLMGAEDENV